MVIKYIRLYIAVNQTGYIEGADSLGDGYKPTTKNHNTKSKTLPALFEAAI